MILTYVIVVTVLIVGIGGAILTLRRIERIKPNAFRYRDMCIKRGEPFYHYDLPYLKDPNHWFHKYRKKKLNG